MNSEAEFQEYMLGKLRGAGWDCQKFQDALQGGIPDVLIGRKGAGAWIELKWIPEWPKRETTKPPLKFRPGQVPWLRRWHGRPLPTGVLLASPAGWAWIPAPNLLQAMKEPWVNLRITPGLPTAEEMWNAILGRRP